MRWSMARKMADNETQQIEDKSMRQVFSLSALMNITKTSHLYKFPKDIIFAIFADNLSSTNIKSTKITTMHMHKKHKV